MKTYFLLLMISLLMNPIFAQDEVSEPRTYCRYVPERMDDFAWENDKIAFRAYGPKLRPSLENSGIDCWLKRVDYPIIDKWYANIKTKSYHVDYGEGHDPYHVRSSAGCGGTGLWIDNKRFPLEAYTHWEVIKNEKDMAQFMLTYENEVNGAVYKEEKMITIRMGESLFDVESRFYKNGKSARGIDICIGLTTHDGKADTYSSDKNGWIATWEELADSELGTGVMVKPRKIKAIENVSSEAQYESHIFIIQKTNCFGKLKYKAGYGWKKAGTITSIDEWKAFLNSK